MANVQLVPPRLAWECLEEHGMGQQSCNKHPSLQQAWIVQESVS